LSNEIQPNCIIKGGPLGDISVPLHIPSPWWCHSTIRMGKIMVGIFMGAF